MVHFKAQISCLATGLILLTTNLISEVHLQCNDSDPAISCSDCNHIRVCLNNTTEIRKICPSSRPYCDETTKGCVEYLPDSCNATPTDEICLEESYQPDFADCTKYNLCYKDPITGKLRASKLKCPLDTYYDYSRQYCYSTYYTACYEFTSNAGGLCFQKNNSWVTYPPNKSIYAHCPSSPRNEEAQVYECPENSIFNTEKIICEP